MKAVVNDKKHPTLVSHTSGVVIVEESGCIIDLDFQLLASISSIMIILILLVKTNLPLIVLIFY